MARLNPSNERLKRDYLRYLKEAHPAERRGLPLRTKFGLCRLTTCR